MKPTLLITTVLLVSACQTTSNLPEQLVSNGIEIVLHDSVLNQNMPDHYKTSHRWEAYYNGQLLSESDFYKIAGYDKESDIAYVDNFTGKYAGYPGIFFGGLWTGLLFSVETETPAQRNIVDAIAVTVGASAIIGSILMIRNGRRVPDKQFPASFAVQAANRYNSN